MAESSSAASPGDLSDEGENFRSGPPLFDGELGTPRKDLLPIMREPDLLEQVDRASRDAMKWDDLRVTWGMRNWRTSAFAQMPLTAKQAKEVGFVQLNNQCAGTFYGFRFMKDNDPSVVLLYDVNGVIAGLQSGVLSNLSTRTEK
ncbi:hypothetical protein HPB52_024546 [Rhipicephalus sanguineus]|uniref:Uncharacterized protein n=1 Tax=Rhipicephalus sanguineus TaxID=34632 RepID=A0A9D4YS06_RHISA|nr:hypothetical protein HPB52_024546 [Rhipicephalus sanguineus]